MRFLWAWLICLLVGCAATPASTGAGLDDMATLSYEKQLVAAEARAADHEPPSLDPATEQSPTPDRPGRQVIYSAGLRVVVVSSADAMRSVQSFAEQAGGHLQKSDSRSITIRVPADKFEATLARISSLGEVVDRTVEASDVTEQMLDLNIRLDNLRKTRERLLEHLVRSRQIETTLKIEAELTRVSGEIEQIEGKLRFLQSQIAMSTIRVELNVIAPRIPGTKADLGQPFDWIERLGDGLVAGNVEGTPRRPGFLSHGPKFDPPEEFIRYYSSDALVEAMSADGLRLKIQKHANYDKGAVAFWNKLARKSLAQSRALVVSDERELGEDRMLLAGTREVAGQQLGYLLVLSRRKGGIFTRDRIFSFEAWGPKALFEARFEALLSSAKSLER